ncbi:hypothetical protein [Thalassospira xiamenensis]|uniref:hypothetical protein n=1 Tax=Thalassospira xiamenensis TaxID=220697 RepID=UPI000A69496B|nr:hypothetical protein [Thalassospira xiamenensis]
MFVNLNTAEITKIDRFVDLKCRRPKSYGELNQLYQLFSIDFRQALEILINRSLLGCSQRTICNVELGWIDKIPVVKSSALTKRTELGDAVIFAYDQKCDSQGNLSQIAARAVILQAKVARSKTQLANPEVPVGYGKSTQDEFKLLSGWPQFDLYNTGGTKKPCIQNVNVAPKCSPPSEAWFLVAPGRGIVAANRASWPCWWMAGKASSKARCSTTIGTLLADFFKGSSVSLQVGADFILPGSMSKSSKGKAACDWSDLCNEIRKILLIYKAPVSIFGPSQPRIYSILSQNRFTLDERKKLLQLRSTFAGRGCLPSRGSINTHSYREWGREKRIPILNFTFTRFDED